MVVIIVSVAYLERAKEREGRQRVWGPGAKPGTGLGTSPKAEAYLLINAKILTYWKNKENS